MKLNDLGETKYIALETFRANGDGVITPVWVVGGNGMLFIWTEANSWKIKRIRNNKRVRLCKCDSRGNPQSDWVEAQATILDHPDDEESLHQLMASKYGLQFRMFSSMRKKETRVFVEIS